MEKDNRSLLNVIKQLETPMMKAIAFAIHEVKKQFPKNNGKIYVSNILGFFVNAKNKDLLISQVGFVPKITKDLATSLVEELAKTELVKKNEGSRSAIYLTFNDDLYAEYEKAMADLKQKAIDDLDLAYVGFAIKEIDIQYPMNNGNVYVSTIYSFFINEKNHPKIIEEFGSVPTYTKDEVELLFEELANRKIIIKNAGHRGATSAKLNKAAYSRFLLKFKREYTKFDYWAVGFAIKTVSEQYPQNKGNIYVSNIVAFFVNEKNHPTIQENLGQVPHYSKYDTEKIVQIMVEKGIVLKITGSRGATYVHLVLSEYNKLVEECGYQLSEDDLKNITFAIKCLNKQYPKNNGKVYLSNISTFFKDKRNVKKIEDYFGYIPQLSRTKIDIILTKLADLKIIEKLVGPRGATYCVLNPKELKAYVKKNKFDIRSITEKCEDEILIILSILNGKSSLDGLTDVIFREDSYLIGNENNEYWRNLYFKNLKYINDDNVDFFLNDLLEKDFIEYEDGYITITPRGLRQID